MRENLGISLVLIAAVLEASSEPANETVDPNILRVIGGIDDTKNEFPFVVVLSYENPKTRIEGKVLVYRRCTGSVIAETWVLTAAQCFRPDVTRIRYGDMSLPPNDTKATFSQIIKQIPHPAYRSLYYKKFGVSIARKSNDIGLALVDRVSIKVFGKVSAIDYSTMLGRHVRYAGFGTTFTEDLNSEEKVKTYLKDQNRPLQIGEGVVMRCPKVEGAAMDYGPFICVAPKCAKVEKGHHGDAGGPLFFGGKIAGLFFISYDYDNRFTPVSPYLDWISEVTTRQHL